VSLVGVQKSRKAMEKAVKKAMIPSAYAHYWDKFNWELYTKIINTLKSEKYEEIRRNNFKIR
jgi:hypothetical protein